MSTLPPIEPTPGRGRGPDAPAASHSSRTTTVALFAVVGLVLGAAGGYLVGNSGSSSSKSGPSTFAEAVSQYRAGTLPAGNLQGSFAGAAGTARAATGRAARRAPPVAPPVAPGAASVASASSGR